MADLRDVDYQNLKFSAAAVNKYKTKKKEIVPVRPKNYVPKVKKTRAPTRTKRSAGQRKQASQRSTTKRGRKEKAKDFVPETFSFFGKNSIERQKKRASKPRNDPPPRRQPPPKRSISVRASNKPIQRSKTQNPPRVQQQREKKWYEQRRAVVIEPARRRDDVDKYFDYSDSEEDSFIEDDLNDTEKYYDQNWKKILRGMTGYNPGHFGDVDRLDDRSMEASFAEQDAEERRRLNKSSIFDFFLKSIIFILPTTW